ncbi:hypothetical protein AHAS_Ahas20G0225100 [Arachis hypogaea]
MNISENALYHGNYGGIDGRNCGDNGGGNCGGSSGSNDKFLLSCFWLTFAIELPQKLISQMAPPPDTMDVDLEPLNSQDNVEDCMMTGVEENVNYTCDCGGSSSKCVSVMADNVIN